MFMGRWLFLFSVLTVSSLNTAQNIFFSLVNGLLFLQTRNRCRYFPDSRAAFRAGIYYLFLPTVSCVVA